MRVLHVITRLNIGGTARYITQLAHELPKHGIETFLATGYVQGAEVEDESAQSIDLIRIPSMGRSFNPIKDHFARKQLSKIMVVSSLLFQDYETNVDSYYHHHLLLYDGDHKDT
jgi:hypothetical protein